MTLEVEVYRLSEQFPRHELFGLSQQMRRARSRCHPISPKGHGRRARQAYINHLNIALGSLAEFETQLLLAIHLGFIREPLTEPATRYARETGQLVMALVHALEKPPSAA